MLSIYPEGTPPALKRHTGWLFGGMALGMLGSLMGLAVSLRFGWPPVIASLGMVAMIACVVILGVRTQRDIALARRLRGQLCPNCLYDLRSLPAEGSCPECGAPYTKRDIVLRWREVDKSYQAKKLYVIDKEENRA